MTGDLYIDSTDVYTAYGVGVRDGGYASVACFPALKAYANNDWQEEHGIEADLSAPALARQDITLNMHCDSGTDAFRAFIAMLTDGVYHTFLMAGAGRTLSLRLVSVSSYEVLGTLQRFTLRLSDDSPMDGYTYLAPSPVDIVLPNADYLVDGVSLTDYGVYVTRGAIADLLRPSDVKTSMQRDIRTVPGVIYDGDADPRLKARDIRIPCVMRAGGVSQLWRNRDALLYDLTRPGTHTLDAAPYDARVTFAYKSCTAGALLLDGQPWLSLNITISNIGGVVGRIPQNNG